MKYNVNHLKDFLKYADHTKLFPLKKNGKSPLKEGWLDRDPYTTKELSDLIRKGYNLGYKLDSTDLIIDIDIKNHPDGKLALSDLILEEILTEYGIENPLIIRTPSDGFHVYLKKDPNIRIRQHDEKRWAKWVDFKSLGGYVVAPGSFVPKSEKSFHNFYIIESLGKITLAPGIITESIEKKLTNENSKAEYPLEYTKKLLDKIDPKDHDNYDDWLKIAMAVHSASGGQDWGLDLLNEWGARNEKYNNSFQISETNRKWASFGVDGGVNAFMLNKFVNEDTGERAVLPAIVEFQDIEIKEIEPNKLISMETFRKDILYNKLGLLPGTEKFPKTYRNYSIIVKSFAEKIGLVYDIFTKRYSFKSGRSPWSDIPFADWTDSDDAAFLNYMSHYGFEIPQGSLDRVLAEMKIDKNFRTNVVRDYLESLSWDGVSRLDNYFADILKIEQNELTKEAGKYLLNGMIARALNENPKGIKSDYIIVLKGEGGTRKSSFVEVLGGQWYSDTDPLALDSNSAKVEAGLGKWLIECPELASLARKDINSVKAEITRNSIRTRLAWARHAADFNKTYVMVGTTNEDQIIRDKTSGSRRFLIFSIENLIDTDKLKDIRNQLFAEAYAIYKAANEQIDLDINKEAKELASKSQEAHRVIDAVEEGITTVLRKTLLDSYASDPKAEVFIATDDLTTQAKYASGYRKSITPQMVSNSIKALKSIKWISVRRYVNGERVRGYIARISEKDLEAFYHKHRNKEYNPEKIDNVINLL